jgi:2-amino-4-hydroxy-6-hydroxymethyldihydropteridine diphosphokinase/dihydropteroate synthase
LKYYLGLGSNKGERKNILESALRKIKAISTASEFRVSPLYETPALLPKGARSDWNKNYLNLVCELECELPPVELLKVTQKIEIEYGRRRNLKWEPRELDIDLLLCDSLAEATKILRLPHPEIQRRAFVLDPLKDLNPNQIFTDGRTVLQLSREHPQHSPLWMAILNLTPDSFSDGGRLGNETALESEIDLLIDSHVAFIDLGAESTRPGALIIDPQKEWERLVPAFKLLRSKSKNEFLRPLISVDTRNYSTAIQAIEWGADLINDVSGLADERFVELIRDCGCSYVLTHSLGVPANPKWTLPENLEVMEELNLWFEKKIEVLLKKGMKQDQIILDPGIGFGKTALQSQIILKNIEQLYGLNCRVLIGHSRKSFLSSISSALPQVLPQERDFESIGISLSMASKGVDILRVHNPTAHIRAFQAWNCIRRSP